MKFLIGISALAALAIHGRAACEATLEFAPGVELGRIGTPKLTEASGIAVSSGNPAVFWTHNDGARDKIYAFRMDGTVLATFALNKSPDDVEDIAIGPGPSAGVNYLYVADIGSNSANRETVKIYRTPEPTIDQAWANDPVSRDFSNVEVCSLKYPDGKFDAEALLLDRRDGFLYIATKQDRGTRVYRAALADLADGKTVALQFVREVDFPKVSGGAISQDGSVIALRQEDFAQAWLRNPGESVGDALGRISAGIPVIGRPEEPNGEGISFLPDGSGYLTISEGDNQPLNFFRRLPTAFEQPRFVGEPVRQPDGLHLSFQACTGTRIAVERSINLATWVQVGTVDMSDSSASFVDAQGGATGFYRLRVL